MTWCDLVREYFPDATDEYADYLLWEYTGFPGFWEGDPVTECRKQLAFLAQLPTHLWPVYQAMNLTPDVDDIAYVSKRSRSTVYRHMRTIRDMQAAAAS